MKRLLILTLLAALSGFFIASHQAESARPSVGPLWAVVALDGSLVRGSGAVSSSQLGADGTYEVIFNRDVSNCAYVASGQEDDALTFGVAPRNFNANGVYIIEYDAILARDSYSAGFYLAVLC